MDAFFAGGLEVIELRGKDLNSPHVILLHGFGAKPEDLVSLSDEIKTGFDINWLFPGGPIEVPFGPLYVGRAWFPIDREKFDKAMLEDGLDDLISISPGGLEAARNLVEGLLKRLPVPMSKVVLGGFSQGAMVATEVALQLREKLAGLAIFSGALLDKKRWKELAKTKAGLPYFQSHGTLDDLLTIKYARPLAEILSESGLVGKYIEFEGGHTIPPSVVRAFQEFLQKQFQ